MDFYDRLGIKKIINGVGTVTVIGGSLMDPEVLAAMQEASRHYVDIRTLHRKAGARVAELLEVEAASITSGASAGIAIAAAACISRGNASVVLQLPDTAGVANEVLMLKAHRILYDQALGLAGARVKEIGVTSFASLAQVEAAISEKTALFFYVVESERTRGSIPLAELAPVLKKHNIPIVVDAAAELPPVSNLYKYLDDGAELVIFSGGKEFRGPQSSGVILGSKQFVSYCDANNYPNYSIGRSMKLDKETIAGFVRAVELFVEKDYEGQMAVWERMVSLMITELSAVAGFQVRRGFPTEPGVQPVIIPRVYFQAAGVTSVGIQERLAKADPSVYIGVSGEEAVINPQCLSEEEVPILLQSIKDMLAVGRG
ncbi:aminotransferase class V-fold PLP-dependent enzyme [Paenibacillus koleovorans]|uniref:aminotransferase class V-fold PLP-dependent enzyme n=1 Tax=Paenibacillus koleovorans TaxID=121608 RepID=UPI000FD923F6|nr:aminotransferase class V-fold PLP-dependent enzyme [Paenibacillus koleovorans]